ncbi:hypothetical protein [Variovorax sp. GB1P17]|uniref:hypothetical protein n=1 Tax=Variovorax sp. GB1P17 TaxID=3443740 RepID=UPI003F4833AC
MKRGAATFELHLALGQPLLTPQTPVKVSGWKQEIDNTDWLSIKVQHAISPDGGFTTHAEFKIRATDVEQFQLLDEGSSP